MKKTRQIESSSIAMSSWTALALLSLIWGSSYILIKRGLESFSPEQVACIRMALTSIAFVPVLLHEMRSINWAKWRPLLVVGFIGSFIPALLFATAQTRVSSSLAGILNSLTPLFTLLLGISFFGVTYRWTKLAGVLLGLSGAVWLLLLDKDKSGWGNVQFGILIILATLGYGVSSNVIKTHLQQMRSLVISATAYLMAGIPASVFLVYSGFFQVFVNNDRAWISFGYLTILALLGTVVASVLYFKLIKDTSALFASTISYLSPAVAIAWGMTDGELFTWLHLAGVAAILAGVYVASR